MRIGMDLIGPTLGDLPVEVEHSEVVADPHNWLFRGSDFPVGVVLLTGTSIVPPLEFTLQAGDMVTVEIPGIGRLRNPVEVRDTRSRRR